MAPLVPTSDSDEPARPTLAVEISFDQLPVCQLEYSLFIGQDAVAAAAIRNGNGDDPIMTGNVLQGEDTGKIRELIQIAIARGARSLVKPAAMCWQLNSDGTSNWKKKKAL